MKAKRNTKTCYCLAYPFPHREGGGKCSVPDYCHVCDDTEGQCFHECKLAETKECPRIEWDLNIRV